jgi:adenosylmethionine---8-amino-7-oxononanoate aminotransferase
MTAPTWFAAGMPHIWLPYTQMKTAGEPLPVLATRGSRIVLADGRELIDGIASWWTACHGYNHPHIADAVRRQLEVMPHVMFGGLAHEPALTLARRLAAAMPEGLDRVFFSDSGSVAVEVAMKMAVQYWRNRGAAGRTRFVAFNGGYHGDTTGAMAVSDPVDGMHHAFAGLLPRHLFCDLPRDEQSLAKLAGVVEQHAGEIAGIIVEPLVQGAGGMIFHDVDALARLRALADRFGLLLIFDEIFTGFGRTGAHASLGGENLAGFGGENPAGDDFACGAAAQDPIPRLRGRDWEGTRPHAQDSRPGPLPNPPRQAGEGTGPDVPQGVGQQTGAAAEDTCRPRGLFVSAAVVPDIVTLSKALTGGTLPLAATIARRGVFDAFWSDAPSDALMHGPTFMANPLACAAANASLDLFEREPRLAQVAAIEQALQRGLAPCRGLPRVRDVRVRGAIGVVELDRIDDVYALRRRFVAEGVFVRPFGTTVYLTPAFTIAPDELARLTDAVVRVVRDL